MADDNRRQVLLLLKDGEKTPTEIVTYFDFSLPALSTHLKVLRDAGLVNERKEGQRKLYSVNRDGMSGMMYFLDQFWDDRLRTPKHFLETKTKKQQQQQKKESSER